MPKTITVVCLNDGETFTDVEGCRIVTLLVPDKIPDENLFIEKVLKGEADRHIVSEVKLS